MTEVRKQSNRIVFGQIEEDVYQTDLGFGVGTLGRKENSGKVRTPAVTSRNQVILNFPVCHANFKYYCDTLDHHF